MKMQTKIIKSRAVYKVIPSHGTRVKSITKNKSEKQKIGQK